MNVHDTMTEITEDAPMDAASALPAPRTRWAAIIWGLVFAGIAAWALWAFSDPERRTEVAGWIGDLTVASAIAYGVLALGSLVLILGLSGILRRVQRRRENTATSPFGPADTA